MPSSSTSRHSFRDHHTIFRWLGNAFPPCAGKPPNPKPDPKPTPEPTFKGQGDIFLDFNDLSTMFVDYSGNTPVTRVGQPVQLVLSKDQNLEEGEDIFAPQDFTNAEGWIGDFVAFEQARNGLTAIMSELVDNGRVRRSFKVTPWKWYKLTMDLSMELGFAEIAETVDGIARWYFSPASGKQQIIFYATREDYVLSLRPTTTTVASAFENLKCVELKGNHMIQEEQFVGSLEYDTENERYYLMCKMSWYTSHQMKVTSPFLTFGVAYSDYPYVDGEGYLLHYHDRNILHPSNVCLNSSGTTRSSVELAVFEDGYPAETTSIVYNGGQDKTAVGEFSLLGEDSSMTLTVNGKHSSVATIEPLRSATIEPFVQVGRFGNEEKYFKGNLYMVIVQNRIGNQTERDNLNKYLLEVMGKRIT